MGQPQTLIQNGEIGELVQPRYKRGIDKYRDSNSFFLHEEHVFDGSSPSFPTIYLNIVGGAVEACNRWKESQEAADERLTI